MNERSISVLHLGVTLIGWVMVSLIGLTTLSRLRVATASVFEKLAHVEALVQADDVGLWKLGVFEHSSDAWVAIESHGTVTMWSDGAEALFGVMRDEVMGYGLGVVIPERMRARHIEGVRSAMSASGPKESDVTCICQIAGVDTEVRVQTWTMPGRTAIARFTVVK